MDGQCRLEDSTGSNTNLPPPELFLDICSFLPPADLFSLSQVCRKFREYLFAPNSLTTQQIWKKSRLQFMPSEDTPPPEGMSEEKYVEILMIERGCQFCESVECQIYWEFEVRCCERCFSKKAVKRFKLTIELRCPLEFINVMPYICFEHEKYYWIKQIDFAYSQYYNLSKKKKKSWLDDKKHKLDSIMLDIGMRKIFSIFARHYLSPFPLLLSPPLSSPSFFSFSPPSPPLPPPYFLFHFSSLSSLSLSYPLPPPLSRFLNILNVQNGIEEFSGLEPYRDLGLGGQGCIQFHIQRLENELRFKRINIETRINSTNNHYNHYENSDKPKRNNFIETKKKSKKSSHPPPVAKVIFQPWGMEVIELESLSQLDLELRTHGLVDLVLRVTDAKYKFVNNKREFYNKFNMKKKFIKNKFVRKYG